MQVDDREAFEKMVPKRAEMTDLLTQRTEALRRIADPRNTHFAGDAQVVAREALAKFDAQAAEQAGGGEAVSNTTTGESNGRHDGIRPAVHGRVALGGYTPGALADLLFASDDVMSLNAELGLTMDQLVRLVQATHSVLAQQSASGEQPAQGNLPPLPMQEVLLDNEKYRVRGFTADQMHAYARAALASQPAAQTARTEADELALLEQLKQKYAPLSPFATEQRMKSKGSFFYVRSAAQEKP